MSYLVLARKYRPRDFEALAGQPHVVQALANALSQQRLHHAYLFTGTRGVGKTTVSRILAKALNCTGVDGQGGITAAPCGACDACRDIDGGRFIDYVELDAASNRGVDEITQLLDQAVYKPVLGRFKVYMIDEVHMLSNHAFNAMLKTLEEPPEYLKFVLATTDPQKVPPTVLSRCLQFNLRPLAPQVVHEHLALVLEREGLPAEPAALHLIARAARGSMRDALSLTDQAIAFGAGSVAEAGVRQMLGAVDRGHAVRLVEVLAARNGGAAIAAVDELRALGLSALGTLEEMALLLQQMAVHQVVPDAADPTDPDAEELARLADLLAPDETQLLYSIVLHGREEIPLAPDEYSGLVMVLLRLLAFPASASPESAALGPGTAAQSTAARSTPALSTGAQSTAALSTVGAATASVALSSILGSKAAGVAGTGRATARDATTGQSPSPAPAAPGSFAAAAAPSQAQVSGLPATRPAAPVVASGAPAPRDVARTTGQPSRARGLPPAWVEAEIPPELGHEHAVRSDGTGLASSGRSAPPDLGVFAEADRRIDAALPDWLESPPLPEPVALDVTPEALPGSSPQGRSQSLELTAQGRSPLGDRWTDAVQRLCAGGMIHALARELAMQAQCLGIDESASPQVWTLRVEREMLRSASHCEKLQSALAALLGAPVRIDAQAGAAEDSPARREAAERARRQAEAEATIENDPLVRALMAQYKTARIVPGSVKSL